jgi:hypothetical protein
MLLRLGQHAPIIIPFNFPLLLPKLQIKNKNLLIPYKFHIGMDFVKLIYEMK